MSTSEMEESRLQNDGYEKVLSRGDIPANLNEGVMLSSPILLWYRRRSHGGSGVRLKPIVDIVISEKLVDSALVIAGYTCLNKSTNKGNVVGKSQYIWIRRAGTSDEEERDAIVDIAVTHGNAKNLSNAIHKPPGRGFIHVTGDLNRRALFAVNIYLWFRPITPRSAEKDWRYGVPEDERNYELECSARRAIRQFVSPADLNFSPRGGPTDFAVLFNRHATASSKVNASKVGTLSVTQFRNLLKEVGLNIDTPDTKHLMHRVDVNNKGKLSREEFLSFVQLNDDELDEVAVKIKDFFGGAGGKKGSEKKMIKTIKMRFKRLDDDGDGVLDIEEFRKMVQMVGIFLTEPELMRLRKVFDPNGDGMIGRDEFESVVLSMSDTTKRQSIRVGDATQALRNYVLQCQREVRKKQNKDKVDSESAWLDLERKHTRGIGGMPFPGWLDLEDVAQAVERLGYRLSQPETRMLIMRVAPDGAGRVSREDFHTFATEPKPRPIGELISIIGRSDDALLREAMNTKLKNEKFKKFINRAVAAIGPDDIGLVTVDGLANGLSTFFNYRDRAGQLTDGELVSVAQYVGAADGRFFMIDPRLFLLGLRADCTGDNLEDMLKECEENGEDIYSELLKDKRKSRFRSKSEVDSDDDLQFDSDGENEDSDGSEYTNEEYEEEDVVSVDDDPLFEVSEVLSDYFRETAEGDNSSSGSLDYEKVLDVIDESRKKDSAINIEDEFTTWLNDINEIQELSDDNFDSLLSRFDPDNTGLLTSGQIKNFCDGKTWDKVKKKKTVIVKKVRRVKKAKKKKKKTEAKTPKRSDKKSKSRKSYYNSSSEEEANSSDDDLNSQTSNLTDDEEDDEEFTSRGRTYSSEDEDDASAVSFDDEASTHTSKSITGNRDTDSAIKEVAFSLTNLHKNMKGAMMEQMVKSEFRRLDVYGSGILPVEEVSRALRNLGYNKKSLTVEKLKFFVDRSGGVDYSGLSGAIGEASWQSNSGKTLSKSDRRFMNKLKMLASGLKDSKRFKDAFKTNSDNEITESSLRKGLKQLQNDLSVSLTNSEVARMIVMITDDENADALPLRTFREFVQTRGKSLSFMVNTDNDDFVSDEGGFSAAQTDALEKLTDELSSSTKKEKHSFVQYLQKLAGGRSRLFVSTSQFNKFLKKFDLFDRLSGKERKHIVNALDVHGKDKLEYKIFIRICIDGKSPSSVRRGGKESGSGSSSVSVDAVLIKIQDNLNTSTQPYGTLFQREDPSGTGLVTRDGLIASLRTIGCYLTEADVGALKPRLKKRGDGMVDYNELYHTILQLTPRNSSIGSMGMTMGGGMGGGTGNNFTPYNTMRGSYGGVSTPYTSNQGGYGGGVAASPWGGNPLGQTWPPPGMATGMHTPWATPYNNMNATINTSINNLGGSAALGGGGNRGDYLLQDVALKLRHSMRQRVAQWGPSVSIHRQFEACDPERRGYIGLKQFVDVLEQLSIILTPLEIGQISRRFDRHGNDTVDYLDFCRFVSIDAREMEIVASKLASKFSELRRRGVVAAATFEVYDLGRTGFVTRRDFREASRQLQLPMTENQLEALMGRFSHQGDSELVSWSEFVTFVSASGVNLPIGVEDDLVGGGGFGEMRPSREGAGTTE